MQERENVSFSMVADVPMTIDETKVARVHVLGQGLTFHNSPRKRVEVTDLCIGACTAYSRSESRGVESRNKMEFGWFKSELKVWRPLRVPVGGALPS